MVKFRYKNFKVCLIIFLSIIEVLAIFNMISFQSYVDEYQQKYIGIAKKELEIGLSIKAKRNLEKVLSFSGQRNEEATLILAHLFLNEGQLSKAISITEENFNVNFSEKSYLIYAKMLEENGELREAINLLKAYPKKNSKEVKQALSSLLSKKSIISKEVTKLQYSTDLITAKSKNKWGYMNKKGQWVIKPSFERSTPFIEELAIVVIDEKAYFIDVNGQKFSVLDKKVDNILPYINSKAAIKINEQWVFVDSEFNVLCEKKDYLGSYANGYAPYKEGNYWGFVNSRNKEVLYGYQEVVINSLGQATVNERFFAKSEDHYFLYNIKGKKIAGPFKKVKAFSSEAKLAAVMNFEDKWGFIDIDGEIRIDYIYENANSFVNELASIKKDGLWGFIDNNNSLVIACKYEKVTDFYNGVSLLQDDEYNLVLLDSYKDLLKLFR